jgi:hypothetical protein
MLSTEMQQQRMVVLYVGFWFCLKQSGQIICLSPTPPTVHSNPTCGYC